MPVTHQQIAEELGLSRTLVTRALHRTRSSRVSVETQREVLAAARRLGYVPRNRTTHNIGYVMQLGGLQTREDMALLLHIEQELRQRDMRLSLINADVPNSQPLSEVLNAKTVDGAILTTWQNGDTRPSWAPGMPYLVASEEEIGEGVDQVTVDLQGTLTNVFRYLRDFGHERIAFIGGTVGGAAFHSRLQTAASRAAAALGWPEDSVQIIGVNPNHAVDAVERAMNSSQPPTALVVSDNFRAVPVLCGLLAAGYSVPADISLVILFDDMQYTTLQPQLTATTASGAEVARQAVDRLLHKIREPDTAPQRIFLAGEIIERNSVAPPRGLRKGIRAANRAA